MTGRQVVPHLDDLGASEGANRAFLELAPAGLVTCGSVMVPGPWFPGLAAACAGGELEVGVHLTLTSEWRSCRWGPISTRSLASGLLDDEGYFPRDVAGLRRGLVVEAAEAEMRAQIERAFASGLRPTHLDSHMGATMIAPLLPAMLRLAGEFGLFPVLPRTIAWAPDPASYAATLNVLAAAGLPVIDHCRGTLPVPPAELDAGWDRAIEALPPGVTHLALHATAPGDFAAAAPDHAVWRYGEFGALRRGVLRAACERAGVAVSGLREMQRQWVGSARAAAAPLRSAETATLQ